MFEAEVNNRCESLVTIPSEILKCFAEYRDRIEARTLIPWGEHCTECVWPSCYGTCELYEPRNDGACRQFVDGVVRIPNPEGAYLYLQKITFRRWAKLWTVASLRCYSLPNADLAERLNILVGFVARNLPLPRNIKRRVLRKIAYIRKMRLSEETTAVKPEPDYFVIEVYNPNDRQVTITLSLKTREKVDRRTYHCLIVVAPGFTRKKVPFSEITECIEKKSPYEVELVPNDSENLKLYFGIIDFVKERRFDKKEKPSERERKKCKCVIWDLDNTLWEGVLIEDGPENLILKEGITDVIAELDKKGILNSIASKNYYNDSMVVLRRLGIADYFLHSQINWQTKSSSVAAIAEALNIGMDTIMFVDDQEFERQEVSSALPQVTVVDAKDAIAIPQREECEVPITEESKIRRLMYCKEQQRITSFRSYKDNYMSFLKDCQIRLVLTHLKEENLERVYELAQRTNQMNFSGNRYCLDELRRIVATISLETYVIKCSDRFGSYGIVGFAVVDVEEARLVDLMFSCRIQGKRVEHAFLSYILEEYVHERACNFYASLRRTKRNAPASAVFGEMGFEEVDTQNGITFLDFKNDQEILDDRIIDITTEV